MRHISTYIMVRISAGSLEKNKDCAWGAAVFAKARLLGRVTPGSFRPGGARTRSPGKDEKRELESSARTKDRGGG